MSTPTIMFTGVFGMDALSLYKMENFFHQWQEILHRQKFLPKIFERFFCSLAVNPENYL